MAVSKAVKIEQVEKLSSELKTVGNVIVATFGKLTVAQDFELRKAIRGAGGKYKVVKNNLAAKAAEGMPAANVLGELKGMTSMAYTASDPVALAKALTAYAKTNPAFVFKAGMVEGRVIDVRSIQDLANMPSKEELIAKVMYLINSGAQRVAISLAGVARNLAAALDQAVKENKFNEQ